MKQTYSSSTRIVKSLAIGILAIASTACNQDKLQEKELSVICIEDVHLDKILLKQVEQKPIIQQLHLSGRVEANPDAVVPFMSMVGGLILNTNFSIGDSVVKGQLLAEVGSAELTSLQNELKRNQSHLLVANHELDMIKNRYKSGFSSKTELLEAEAEVTQIKNDITAVTETLSLYSASSKQGVFQIKAPISGFIIEKNINAGQRIAADSDPLFVISNLESVLVVANLYASDVAKVKVGDIVEIETIAYPGTRLTGAIASIAQVFDSEEQVLKARIPMKNPNQKLIPGALVDVWLESEVGEAVNVVETQAVIFDNNAYKLVLYKDACNLRVVDITPVAQNPSFTYFQEHIEASEQYVIKNPLLIYTHLNELN